MSILNSNQVHKPDSDFNQEVVEAIILAKSAKDSRDYIDCISGGKRIEDIKQNKIGNKER